jgi:hypothetical protein
MLKIDVVLRYKQRSMCWFRLQYMQNFILWHLPDLLISSTHHTEIVWEERRLTEFLKLNGNLVAARYDSKKTIFLKGPRKQKNRLWNTLELCTSVSVLECLQPWDWDSTCMVDLWSLSRSLQELHPSCQLLDCFSVSWLKMVQSCCETWEIDRWVVKLHDLLQNIWT